MHPDQQHQSTSPTIDQGFTPLISVVLCTHNQAERLRKTLLQIRNLTPPSRPWELLVVNNNCSDNSAELLAEQDWRPEGLPIRVVLETKLGLSNARNRGVVEANGEYLLFVDDDENPCSDWLVAYEQEILTHQPDALGGRIEVMFEHGDRPPWLQDELLGFLGLLNHGEAQWLTEPRKPFYGGNFAVKKTVFDTAGNFDAELGRKGRVNSGGEDTDFYRRLLDLGCRIRWVPDAIIYHRIRSDKLRRSYFLELHYRQGISEGLQKRGDGRRIPPPYLFGQWLRSLKNALAARLSKGRNHSLRAEMNVIYFTGYIKAWILH